MEEGLQISFSFQHSKTSDGRSVLCIQPISLFQKNKKGNIEARIALVSYYVETICAIVIGGLIILINV